MTPLLDGSAQGIAAAVKGGGASAVEVVKAALGRIEARDGVYGVSPTWRPSARSPGPRR